MEKIKQSDKFTNFSQAVKALERSIHAVQKVWDKSPGALRDTLVAGVLQHFELAYETCWKYLKYYLESALEIEVALPKSTFRACYERKVIDYETLINLLSLADERNKTAHIYDQEVAQEIFDVVVEHHEVFKSILSNQKGRSL